ncbi:hypothetical protein V1521DRAFT_449133 [Lipomyces starkeyi]
MDEVVVYENGDEHLIDNNFIEEEMYVEEQYFLYSEADKISTPGDSERTFRRWKANLKTNIRMGSLLDYNFTVSSGSN